MFATSWHRAQLMTGSIMPISTKKILYGCGAAIVFCAIAYGMAQAQLLCCGVSSVERCISAHVKTFDQHSDRIARIGRRSHEPDRRIPPKLRSESICSPEKPDFGPGQTCCETARCSGYTLSAYLIPDPVPYEALQGGQGRIAGDHGAQISSESNELTAIPISVPIYLMTQSILC